MARVLKWADLLGQNDKKWFRMLKVDWRFGPHKSGDKKGNSGIIRGQIKIFKTILYLLNLSLQTNLMDTQEQTTVLYNLTFKKENRLSWN